MDGEVAAPHRRGELQGAGQQGRDPADDVQHQPGVVTAVAVADRLRARQIGDGVPNDVVERHADDERPERGQTCAETGASGC